MINPILRSGVYAIINKRLNLVYVGITEDCFLIRWIEHLRRIPNYISDNDRTTLYLAEDTKYIVLKELDPNEYSKKEFYELEVKAQTFYKQKGWIVVSTSTFREDTNYSDWTSTKKSKNERYMQAISHMITTIGKSENQKDISTIYNSLYKEINQEFNTNVYNRSKKAILQELTAAELLYILLSLYPLYKVERLKYMRTQPRQMALQILV
ncbi:hypothetical protein [Priestia aryabhattai]